MEFECQSCVNLVKAELLKFSELDGTESIYIYIF